MACVANFFSQWQQDGSEVSREPPLSLVSPSNGDVLFEEVGFLVVAVAASVVDVLSKEIGLFVVALHCVLDDDSDGEVASKRQMGLESLNSFDLFKAC